MEVLEQVEVEVKVQRRFRPTTILRQEQVEVEKEEVEVEVEVQRRFRPTTATFLVIGSWFVVSGSWFQGPGARPLYVVWAGATTTICPGGGLRSRLRLRLRLRER